MTPAPSKTDWKIQAKRPKLLVGVQHCSDTRRIADSYFICLSLSLYLSLFISCYIMESNSFLNSPNDLPTYLIYAICYLKFLTPNFPYQPNFDNEFHAKAELPQEGILFRTQFPSLGIFINKKVGFRKNSGHLVYRF